MTDRQTRLLAAAIIAAQSMSDTISEYDDKAKTIADIVKELEREVERL